MLYIYGAGIAGLLAARMLRHMGPVVCEASEGPIIRNHFALLRFRSEEVGAVLGIKMRKVQVRKAVWDDGQLYERASIAHSNAYSLKVAGTYESRSILDLEEVERWEPPVDFFDRIAAGIDVIWETPLTAEGMANHSANRERYISTIPLPQAAFMANVLNKTEHGGIFQSEPIWTYSINIEAPRSDLHQTIYYPGRETKAYRLSILGHIVTVEFSRSVSASEAHTETLRLLEDIGIVPVAVSTTLGLNSQRHGKISCASDTTRKAAIVALTDGHRLYSLGRFATWRNIVTDDLVKDVRRIEAMMVSGDYVRRLQSS